MTLLKSYSDNKKKGTRDTTFPNKITRIIPQAHKQPMPQL